MSRWPLPALRGRRRVVRAIAPVILGAGLVALAIANASSARPPAAVAQPQSAFAATRATPGAPGRQPGHGLNAFLRRGSAKSRVATHPVEHFLTRAEDRVFDVRTLKGIVGRRERPEHEDPFLLGSEAEGALPSAIAPGLAPPATATAAPPPDASFDGLDFANWGAGHPPDTN